MKFREKPCLVFEGSRAGNHHVVDVLMPYYNTGLFVRDQVNSIQKQTFGNFRLTVLDNGSREADAAIIRELLAEMENARLFRVEENVGVLNAFEFLLSTVTSPYFSLSDSDDIWDSDKLDVSMQVLKSQNLDLVYTDLRMADESGVEFFPSKWKYSNTPPLQGKCPLQFVLKNPVSGCTIVGQRRMIARAVPFPEGIPMHDRWLAIVAALGEGAGFVDRQTMYYRQHGSNDTGGLGFGIAALKERMRRNGGNVQAYTRRRLESRKVLLRHISNVSPRATERRVARWMLSYYELGIVGTVFAALPYVVLAAFVGRDLGLRNIAADTILNIVRVFSSIRARA